MNVLNDLVFFVLSLVCLVSDFVVSVCLVCSVLVDGGCVWKCVVCVLFCVSVNVRNDWLFLCIVCSMCVEGVCLGLVSLLCCVVIVCVCLLLLWILLSW